MCGIAGFLRTPGVPNREQHAKWLVAMGQAVIHRGPDAGDTWMDNHIGLAHRRLSILDLSSAGNQPMVSHTERYVIAFNGEIYNFEELKGELIAAGHQFHTRTDTEVLLTLYEELGPKCLDKLNGMFAIAIWDRTSKKLFLARDRLGKKPLYYYQCGDQFAFASEIKALTPAPFVKTELRYDAVRDFFAYQYVPDPKSIYRNIHKLAPGYWLLTDGEHTQLEQYWDVSFSNPSQDSAEELTKGLYSLIDDAVRLRMVSDVPLGAFLSGGVDSSAVVGLMAGHRDSPVTTCSIGFDSKRFDEVVWARKVAEQFKTDHHEFTVREDLPGSLADISRYFDEPFADPSYVPTYFVSQLARKQVTVALAGDGGDENFAGYGKYYTDQIENQLRSKFPASIRHNVFPALARFASMFKVAPARKASSLLATLATDSAQGFYTTNCFFRPSVWGRLVIGDLARETKDYDPGELTREVYRKADTDDHLASVLYTDLKTFLPGDILTKVDRMSMANSLETRAPLLDYRVVEYAAKIPSALKLSGKEKKYILKEAFSKMLPDDILYRKKMGFSVPLAEWLRNEIKPLAEQRLFAKNSGLANFFNMGEVRKMWIQHLTGDNQYTQELWMLLAFELWWAAYHGD
jgi:asparagine synthase (glutamine-hydrolysing)